MYNKPLLLALSILTIPQTNALSLAHYPSLKKIGSFFTPHAKEIIDHKEFPASSLSSLSIENNIGPVTIKTGWKKDYVCLKTIKRARKQVDLNGIEIIADSTKPHHLSLATHYANETTKGSVEYELIIPTSLNISLKTGKGDLLINDLEGKIWATTAQGNITITNSKNNIYAQSFNNGTIFIKEPHGAVKLSSESGSIIIEDAHNNVIAHSNKGKIAINYTALTNAHAIDLATTTGNITLTLPSLISAAITGSTHYGTLLSDHYITLAPYTTQLNNVAWKKFKKEVNGTIGTGDTQILLHSMHGNIRILKTEIS